MSLGAARIVGIISGSSANVARIEDRRRWENTNAVTNLLYEAESACTVISNGKGIITDLIGRVTNPGNINEQRKLSYFAVSPGTYSVIMEKTTLPEIVNLCTGNGPEWQLTIGAGHYGNSFTELSSTTFSSTATGVGNTRIIAGPISVHNITVTSATGTRQDIYKFTPILGNYQNNNFEAIPQFAAIPQGIFWRLNALTAGGGQTIVTISGNITIIKTA